MVIEPIYRAIKELRDELARLDHVIAAVEAMKEGKMRRGRPPKFIRDLRRGAHDAADAPKNKAARSRRNES